MPNALPGNDLLPPSSLLRLTDVQHSGAELDREGRRTPSRGLPDVRPRVDVAS